VAIEASLREGNLEATPRQLQMQVGLSRVLHPGFPSRVSLVVVSRLDAAAARKRALADALTSSFNSNGRPFELNAEEDGREWSTLAVVRNGRDDPTPSPRVTKSGACAVPDHG